MFDSIRKFFSGKSKVTLAIFGIIAIGLYYYFELPIINIHSRGLWKFIMFLLFIILVIIGGGSTSVSILETGKRRRNIQVSLPWHKKAFKGMAIVLGVVFAIYIIGSVLSSPLVNAGKYQKLLKVEKSEFTKDITQISYKQIPLLDKDSAAILGERKMGSLVDLASQFEVADEYTQINYQDNPVRVTPLRYASPIKWFTNRRAGIPGFMSIDMTSKKTNLIRLKEGMKYSPYEYFNRYLIRHLRFKHPTYIYDDISFEIDEEGTPYWVCSVARYRIGLFGGRTIGKVVLCNAITGECTDYNVEDVPAWVDRVYSAGMLIRLYNYYGCLKHGYINSILGQRDCLTTTNGYNYLALNDDVWVYTGVTSITSDQSNVGFVLMNQRTMETKYYEIEGSIEDSAMTSAEGKVQNLGYRATFPILLNIDGQPTYFMALKDNSGLVKKYAMVNVQDSQLVSTGDEISECEKNYRNLLKSGGYPSADDKSAEEKTAAGVIARIAQAVVEGNTHYYILLKDSDTIYDVNLSTHLEAILLEEGDEVILRYTEGGDRCIVDEIEKK